MIPNMQHGIERSKRYVICAPLQYRIRGERVWHPGVSRNMSQSGILFEGATPLRPGAQFEVQLTLESVFGARKRTSIRFQGTIVRSPREGLWAARICNRRLRRVETGRGALGERASPNSVAFQTGGTVRLHELGAEAGDRIVAKCADPGSARTQ